MSDQTAYYSTSCGTHRGRRFHMEVAACDSGSAPISFVLMLAPMVLLLQALGLVFAKGQLDAATFTQATQLMRVCALADSDSDAVAKWNLVSLPGWISSDVLDCDRGDLAKLQLQTSVKGFPWIKSKAVLHAFREDR